jgi:DNA-binding NtrC family response regulator
VDILATVSGRRRVLVIEDDAGIREMLGLALDGLGHEAHLASGIGPIPTAGMDAAILDLRLGNRSALDVLDAYPELRKVPLIVCTAGDPAPAAAIEGAIVLRKPFDLVALERVLGAALSDGDAAPQD